AIKSPQILEQSGIGRPDVLSKIGVPVKVALDGVGENVQEHQFIGVTYEVKAGASTETYDLLRDEKEAAKHLELYAKAEGIYMSGITNLVFMSLHDYTLKADAIYEAEKARVTEGIKSNEYPPGLAEQYEIQLERLRNKRTGPEMVVVPGFLSVPKPPEPGKQYFTIIAAVNHNFSRGTIHTVSSDPLVDPEMDPHYFEHDIDRQTFVALVQYIRRVSQTAPLSDFLGVELNPGPEFDTDEKLAAWVPQGCATTYHTAGSLSMLPREKNGVVDPSLKVYGTKNIRVVDLSIVPLHFAAHPQATVYAIAEQGGGTAGLALAARLSEDASITVLVLDAGNHNLEEPLISRPAQYGHQFFNPKFDWGFRTVPQKYANGQQYDWHRGKSLGGSSAMNFSAWTVPPKSDIDDWEKLGNKGWNWENYQKYLSRSTTYTPLDLTAADTVGRDKESLKIWDINNFPAGTGPLHVTHPREIRGPNIVGII
ncbi:hypothetical protein MPER_12396, partial [Moniliophthora perniciosa FA553]